MMKEGNFREDLYYRLNVVTVELPPLRKRGEDVNLLLNHFLNHFAEENSFETPTIDSNAIDILRNYSWPGNVRELRNFCENLVVLKRGSKVSPYDLDPRFSLQNDESMPFEIQSSTSNLSKEENEKRLLRNALLQSKGNKTKAAELMGISRRTLHRKLIVWPELDIS